MIVMVCVDVWCGREEEKGAGGKEQTFRTIILNSLKFKTLSIML